jgi:AcrR family transcriptional regulator
MGAVSSPRRPAHRPSRRNDILDAATGLFATLPVDEVTVQDIATAVDMTPAAVYYHFASKEQILVEGMQQFRDDLLAAARSHAAAHRGRDGVRSLIGHLVAWTAKRKTPATVYFVSSLGLNLMVEALRRETRLALIDVVTDVVRSSRGRLDHAEAGVISVALVSLLETSLAAMLNQDAAYRALGAKRFGAEIGVIADRIAGLGSSR